MADQLLTERNGAVTVITLNRPDRMNTISGTMLSELSTALLEADRNPEVRAVVLTGAGRAFCAGLDLEEQSSGSGLDIGGRSGEFDLRDAPPIVLHEIDVPTICALNGGAAGYGMDLALGCDIRIAAENAKMAPAFTKRGVLPESGGTWLLPRLVGASVAAEIFFTGETLGSDRLLELGLVSRVVPAGDLMGAAMDVANRVAANAPLAVRAAKRMLRYGAEEGFSAHVQRVYLTLLPLFRTKDFREGMMSFLEKRPADFQGQ
ncbi:MAG TPA: enoyl-CoA hydratase-related protein [Acidimicrobiales bacterium]|jgi:enoyl-CoA hydratase/carnithine racemase|nr:enoyl-CoA hydratase-related protein [Acidimicrobiales bacterium]